VAHNGLRLAVGTLTVVPVRPPTVVDRSVARRAMLLAPVAALGPAVAAMVVCLLGSPLGVPPLVVGALAVGALGLASRGLHLDGLADTADGLAASHDRERALVVMHSGDVGPAGAVTLAVAAIAQAGSIGALVGSWRGAVLVAAAVVGSRGVLAMCCATAVPSARPTGLGATVAGTVPVAAAVATALLVAAGTSLVGMVAGLPWWRGAVAVLVGLAAAGVLLLRCVRRLGGVTGDVLGACVEVALTAGLVVLALTGPSVVSGCGSGCARRAV